MPERIVDELATIDLGDARLNRRSKKVLKGLAADCQASVNGAFHSWGETTAAYRLMDNAQVTPEAILRPHAEATRRRIAEQPVVLVLQDTTELDYSKHPPRDAGCLTKPERRGFYLHPQLAVAPSGFPLGLLDAHLFDRDEESLGRRRNRREEPIEAKESHRWLRGYQQAAELAGECPQTQIISVADCEADIYEIFLDVKQRREAGDACADFVIRSKENRRLDKRVPPDQHNSRNAVYYKLRDTTRAAPVRFTKVIELPQTHKRAARRATLEVRAEPVTIKHPKNRRGLPSFDGNIVYVQEVDAGRTAIDEDSVVEWWLLTSLPIDTTDDIERVLAYYTARWTIETYFRVLKTGCRVEQMQLETVDRVQTCLAFYLIIAWSTLRLTHLNRTSPDLPCDAVFADCEWKSVYQITTGEKPPTTPLPLSEFIRLLASLGGYNNRPSEPPPGPQPIWIGVRRMHDFTLAWLAFNPDG